MSNNPEKHSTVRIALIVLTVLIVLVASLLAYIFLLKKQENSGNNNQAATTQSQTGSPSSSSTSSGAANTDSYDSFSTSKIPGTAQTNCYDNTSEIKCPSEGQAFYGQDGNLNQAQNSTQYKDNKDGTVTDLITGLTWTKAANANLTYDQAIQKAESLSLAGYDDWRLPSVKELYSLIRFDGVFDAGSSSKSKPFIDTTAFDFNYGGSDSVSQNEQSAGNRWIDVQEWSSTKYVSTTMNIDKTVFGVNFADGRIKGYPQYEPGSNNSKPRQMYARFVRGDSYGQNKYEKSASGQSIKDNWSGLTWQQNDDGKGRNWQEALQYCQDLSLDGYNDWRLPNAKELQSIVDYSRSPATTNSAAIDPILAVSKIEGYYWSSTTILDGLGSEKPSTAVYIAFGRAMGYQNVPPTSPVKKLIDVHGAGAQRSDPKAGDSSAYPQGFGPQGDDIRIYNLVRCVRS